MGFEEFLKGLRHKASYTYLETSMALESFRFKSLQFKGFLSRLYKGSIRLRDTGFGVSDWNLSPHADPS